MHLTGSFLSPGFIKSCFLSLQIEKYLLELAIFIIEQVIFHLNFSEYR